MQPIIDFSITFWKSDCFPVKILKIGTLERSLFTSNFNKLSSLLTCVSSKDLSTNEWLEKTRKSLENRRVDLKFFKHSSYILQPLYLPSRTSCTSHILHLVHLLHCSLLCRHHSPRLKLCQCVGPAQKCPRIVIFILNSIWHPNMFFQTFIFKLEKLKNFETKGANVPHPPRCPRSANPAEARTLQLCPKYRNHIFCINLSKLQLQIILFALGGEKKHAMWKRVFSLSPHRSCWQWRIIYQRGDNQWKACRNKCSIDRRHCHVKLTCFSLHSCVWAVRVCIYSGYCIFV